MKKVIDLCKNKYLRMSVMAMTLCMCTMATAFAVDDSSGAGDVVSIITAAASDLKTQAMIVIGLAVGIGIVFWGAGLLWRHFKSMSK